MQARMKNNRETSERNKDEEEMERRRREIHLHSLAGKMLEFESTVSQILENKMKTALMITL
jgi:hypothetical protein